MQKFQNRIVSNLIYYQTNYGISALGIFGLITFMNPFKMSVGILTMALIFGLLYYLDASQIQVKKVKKDHPTLVMLGTFLAAYFFIHLVSSNRKINDASIKHFRVGVSWYSSVVSCFQLSSQFFMLHSGSETWRIRWYKSCWSQPGYFAWFFRLTIGTFSRWLAWLRLLELERKHQWLSSWLSGALSLTSNICHKPQMIKNNNTWALSSLIFMIYI